jgi:hypothetical protein
MIQNNDRLNFYKDQDIYTPPEVLDTRDDRSIELANTIIVDYYRPPFSLESISDKESKQIQKTPKLRKSYTEAFDADFVDTIVQEHQLSPIEELIEKNQTYFELFTIPTKSIEDKRDSFETPYFQSLLLKYELNTLGKIILAVKNGNPAVRYSDFPKDCVKLLCKFGINAEYNSDEQRIILPDIIF